MSRCAAVRKVLPAWLEGDADPRSAFETARHLDHCRACREEGELLRRLDQALSSLEPPLEPPEAFVERVMTALPPGPPPPKSRRLLRLVLPVIVAGLFAALAWTATWMPAGRLVEALPGVSHLGPEAAPTLLEHLVAMARFVWVAAAQVATASALGSPQSWELPYGMGLVALPLMLAALASMAALLACLARLQADVSMPSSRMRSESLPRGIPSRRAAAARSPRQLSRARRIA